MKTVRRVLTLLVLLEILPLMQMSFCSGAENISAMGETLRIRMKEDPGEGRRKNPILIWYHNVHRDSPSALKTALSSGLISDVMIKCLNRKDFNFERARCVIEAVEIAREFGVGIIWSRAFWPTYKLAESRLEDLFDSKYYVNEIRIIREEKEAVGANAVALDVEAHGHSPIKRYMKGKERFGFREAIRLKNVIDRVIKIVGKVDFLMPAGSNRISHPYNCISGLANSRISEHTYYANEKILKSIKYPYEIFGVYLNTVKENQMSPKLPYYLVPEIFAKSYLWSNKKGLFLYPKEGNALAVAKELVKYSKNGKH